MDAGGATSTSIFDRIVCGVDGTPESLFAVKQANRLQQPEGSPLLVLAMSLAKTVHAGMEASHAAQLMETEAEEAMAEAKALVSAEAKILNGDPATVLLNEAQHATCSRSGRTTAAVFPQCC
jgi:hypothetical protein